MSDGIAIMGWLDVEPQGLDLWSRAAAEMVAATLNEPGCREYAIGVSMTGSSRVIYHEYYADEAALQDHLSSAHFKAFAQEVAGVRIVRRSESRRLVVAGTYGGAVVSPLRSPTEARSS